MFRHLNSSHLGEETNSLESIKFDEFIIVNQCMIIKSFTCMVRYRQVFISIAVITSNIFLTSVYLLPPNSKSAATAHTKTSGFWFNPIRSQNALNHETKSFKYIVPFITSG